MKICHQVRQHYRITITIKKLRFRCRAVARNQRLRQDWMTLAIKKWARALRPVSPHRQLIRSRLPRLPQPLHQWNQKKKLRQSPSRRKRIHRPHHRRPATRSIVANRMQVRRHPIQRWMRPTKMRTEFDCRRPSMIWTVSNNVGRVVHLRKHHHRCRRQRRVRQAAVRAQHRQPSKRWRVPGAVRINRFWNMCCRHRTAIRNSVRKCASPNSVRHWRKVRAVNAAMWCVQTLHRIVNFAQRSAWTKYKRALQDAMVMVCCDLALISHQFQYSLFSNYFLQLETPLVALQISMEVAINGTVQLSTTSSKIACSRYSIGIHIWQYVTDHLLPYRNHIISLIVSGFAGEK